MKKVMMAAGGVILGCSLSAHAYIGPGVGVTLIGWFVGCFLAVAAALWAVVFWPLKRLLAKVRPRRNAAAPGPEPETSEEK